MQSAFIVINARLVNLAIIIWRTNSFNNKNYTYFHIKRFIFLKYIKGGEGFFFSIETKSEKMNIYYLGIILEKISKSFFHI